MHASRNSDELRALAAANRVRSQSVHEAAVTPAPALAAGASVILFQMDVIHGLTLSEIHPDAVTTAYGPLADFLTIARGEQANT